jgi:hypothetical protein
MLNPNESDRVRANTATEINEKIDRQITKSVRFFSGKSEDEINQRIHDLEREWDMERLLETNASALAFAGVVLGVVRNKKWLFLPGIVLPFLLQHAVQGWCPPVPLFRRLGVRTREEIEREKFALKALRGDFEEIDSLRRGEEAEDAVEAAKA